MDLTEIFRQLVEIDSPTGNEETLRTYIVDLLKKEKLVDKVDLDNYGNIYAYKEGTGTPIFFSAHLDTVEPGRGIKLTSNKGYLTSAGDTILGADNKAALAAIISALYEVRDQDIETRPFELVLTLSEEVGNYGAINFDYSLLQSQKGYCMDSSSNVGGLVTASPFYERFDLKLIGKAAHASRPDEAINVLNVFHKLLNKFSLGQLDEYSIINIGIVAGGHVRNTIPGELILNGEIRSYAEKKLEQHKARFERVLKKTSRLFNATFELEWVRENPGYRLTSPEARAFIDETKSIIKNLGLRFSPYTTWGVSDASIFNDKGLICINLADGTEFSHSTNERIKLSELKKLGKLALAIMKQK